MVRTALRLMTVSLGIVIGSAATHAACDKMEKVTAVYLPVLHTMPLYIAIEEKLFEKACIELSAVKMEAPNQIIDALVSSRADFGPPGAAAGISMIAEAKYPGTFKIFGLQGGGIKSDLGNDFLIVKADSNIKTLADLKGKNLGHIPGIQWRTISRHLLTRAGLDPGKDVKLTELPVGLQAPALLAGTVDATLSLEPTASIAVASGLAKIAIRNPVASVIGDPFYPGVALLTTKLITERPQVARKLVDVFNEATSLANGQFDKYRALLPKFTPLQADQVGALSKLQYRSFADINDADLTAYQAFIDVFRSEGVLTEPLDVRTKMLKASDLPKP